jgi:hypothetical protein
MEKRRKIKFKQNLNRLYFYKSKESFNTQENINNETSVVNTVEENKQFFTNRQIGRAYKARELDHILRTPSIYDFKTIISMDAIKSINVTLEDVNILEVIFGLDLEK